MGDPIEVTSIADLAVMVNDRQVDGRRTVIAIAGPPGAGKTTTADALVDALNDIAPGSAAGFGMDGYHFDDLVLDERGWRPRKGAPHTFDVAGFAHMLKRLRRNDEAEVAVPLFDRSIEIARAGARIIPGSVTHLVVEGNYLLLDHSPWDSLTPLFDLTVAIDVPEAELRRRLVERWKHLSGTELDEKLEGNDLPNMRLVLTQSRRPDVIYRQTS